MDWYDMTERTFFARSDNPDIIWVAECSIVEHGGNQDFPHSWERLSIGVDRETGHIAKGRAPSGADVLELSTPREQKLARLLDVLQKVKGDA